MIEGLSAITLATHDMRRAVRFYQGVSAKARSRVKSSRL